MYLKTHRQSVAKFLSQLKLESRRPPIEGAIQFLIGWFMINPGWVIFRFCTNQNRYRKRGMKNEGQFRGWFMSNAGCAAGRCWPGYFLSFLMLSGKIIDVLYTNCGVALDCIWCGKHQRQQPARGEQRNGVNSGTINSCQSPPKRKPMATRSRWRHYHVGMVRTTFRPDPSVFSLQLFSWMNYP